MLNGTNTEILNTTFAFSTTIQLDIYESKIGVKICKIYFDLLTTLNNRQQPVKLTWKFRSLTFMSLRSPRPPISHLCCFLLNISK